MTRMPVVIAPALLVACKDGADLTAEHLSWPGQCAPEGVNTPDTAWSSWIPRLEGAEVAVRVGEVLASGTLDADGTCLPTWVGAVDVRVVVDEGEVDLVGVSRLDESTATWTLDAGAASDVGFGCEPDRATHVRLRVDRVDGVDEGGLTAICSNGDDGGPGDEIQLASVL